CSSDLTAPRWSARPATTSAASPTASPRISAEPAVELAGEGLAVALAEGSRAAGVDAGRAQGIHEIAHRQALADGLRRVDLAAGADGEPALGDGGRSQRNVLGDHQVAGVHAGDDLVVGLVEAAAHLQEGDVRRGRHRERLVGDQGERNPGAPAGAEQDVLDDAGAGIGVDPDAGLCHGVAGSRGGGLPPAARRRNPELTAYSLLQFGRRAVDPLRAHQSFHRKPLPRNKMNKSVAVSLFVLLASACTLESQRSPGADATTEATPASARAATGTAKAATEAAGRPAVAAARHQRMAEAESRAAGLIPGPLPRPYPMPAPPVADRERYQALDTNPVRLVAEAPVSTFGIDVDT